MWSDLIPLIVAVPAVILVTEWAGRLVCRDWERQNARRRAEVIQADIDRDLGIVPLVVSKD